ncbi:unnamed protein product [Leptidea sinapis]|uniref:Uncharacterized protein n=1 Tax=Leptidea sinapis TaxID=189913 RepID=A0A5E4QB21_9NEOP|nr:unnamed protein product [Leptidea sinapis]
MSCDCKEEQKKGREGISRTYYGYYDTPEGCNIDKKMMSLARYGAAIGAIISTYDVLMYSRAVGFIPMLKRYMFHSGSLMLMGATFAAVANGALLRRGRPEGGPGTWTPAGAACTRSHGACQQLEKRLHLVSGSKRRINFNN